MIHPLAHIPVEPWMFRRAREQAELLMQITLHTPSRISEDYTQSRISLANDVPKPETPRKPAA